MTADTSQHLQQWTQPGLKTWNYWYG